MKAPPDLDAAPRYAFIAQDLRRQIAAGELAPGDRLPSFAHMRAQGISQNTMEKVYILLESEGLIDRAGGSGVYVADGTPRKRTSTGIIGYVGGPSPQPQQYGMHLYGAHIQQGAREAAKKHGLHLMLLDADSDADVWRKLDGVLSLEQDVPAGIPRVHLMTVGETGPSVVADEDAGIIAAVNHLAALGHRRIAYLIDPHEPYHSQRLNAYRAGLHANRIQPDAQWVRHIRNVWEHANAFVGAAAQRMEEWLREDWHRVGCTALLCQNDQVAIGALQALRAAGLGVPDDVSVIGFDGTEAADFASPRLTTIEVPLYDIGAAGVELLLQRIATGTAPKVRDTIRALPTSLRIGGSTAPVNIGLVPEMELNK